MSKVLTYMHHRVFFERFRSYYSELKLEGVCHVHNSARRIPSKGNLIDAIVSAGKEKEENVGLIYKKWASLSALYLSRSVDESLRWPQIPQRK